MTHLAPGSPSGRIGPSSSSPPFRLALAWSPSPDAPLTCSCSRSPPFRLVREHRILLWHPPLYPITILTVIPERRYGPALHHLGWPWLRPPLWLLCESQRCIRNPAHHHLGWPWSVTTLLSPHLLPHLCFLLLPIFSSSLAAPPAESKVIQIQSDHLLVAPPPVAAMERSKVTCPIQVCWRQLGPHQEGLLWPSHEVHWAPCWMGSYFSSSSLMLLSYTNSLLTFATDTLPWWIKRVWFPSSAPPSLFFWRASGLLLEGTTLSSPHLFPPCAAPFSQVHLGRILHALGMVFAMLTHWVSLTVSLASHLSDILSTMVWLCLAICWRRTSERILSVCSLHALSFVSLGFTKSWVGQVALRSPINRHALDLTVSLDDQGH